MSDSDNTIHITEDGLFDVVTGLLAEIVRSADAESELVEAENLTKEQKSIVMKANTLLTFAAMHAFAIVETRNIESARLLLEVWSYPTVRELTEIAFAEEIAAAKALVDQMVEQMEQEANKETNESSSEPSS